MSDDTQSQYVRFHVVLLVQESQEREMIALSQSLNVNHTNSIELGADMIPHITLYNPEIPQVNYRRGLELIEEISQKYQTIILENPRFERPPRGDSGLFINYDASDVLLHLQDVIINVINPLRDGRVRAQWQNNEEYSEEIMRYGYPLSLYHFPHVTLAEFQTQEERERALSNLENIQEISHKVRSIAVVETGPHGTAKRIIKEFLL